MNNLAPESTVHVLNQIRILIVLAVLMVFASVVVDPPYSSAGILLVILVVVVLGFTLLRIHRTIVVLKSSFPTL